MNKKIGNILEYLLLFFISSAIILTIYIVYGYDPFGGNSLACMDANIQYLSFFAYLKDLLQGTNNIYSFSKTLGGNMFAVITFYLSSPVNILVLFFDKQNLNTFFDITLIIKLSFISCTMFCFFKNRFNSYIGSFLTKVIIFVLSLSYAMSQYTIAQASNIMWLDGVCMLPLILLGVWKLCYKQSAKLLTVSLFLSFLFNWYTACINLLFSVVWLFVEIILSFINKGQKLKIKNILNLFLTYIHTVISVIILSAVILLPTISALKTGSRGFLELYRLVDFNFVGNLFSAIQSYYMGATSTDITVSLYCGSFVIIGCIAILLERNISIKLKLFFSVFMIFILMLFYWQPFILTFSLFKEAIGHWYRYSYVAIFSLVFFAGYFYLIYGIPKYKNSIIKATIIFIFLLLAINIKGNKENINFVQYTCIFAFLIGCMYYCILLFDKNKKQVFFIISFVIIFLFELFCGTRIQMNNYTDNYVYESKEHFLIQQQMVNYLKSIDNSFYRISQTYTRNMSDYNTTSNYNESLSCNFYSISGYSSSPDDIQRDFLDKIGYRKNGKNFCIVNTSVLSADSLLGVKYIFSKYNIKGYEIKNYQLDDDKKILYNSFYLPIAFKYNNSDLKINYNSENPFEYQNKLYSKLVGKDIEILKKVDYSVKEHNNNQIIYELNVPYGNFSIYGNIPFLPSEEQPGNVILDINKTYKNFYSCSLSPSVFYIPFKENQDKIDIICSYEKNPDFKYGEEQFYALDLDLLREITTYLRERKADIINIKNGKVDIVVEGNENESLYVAIPYDKGWTILLNGNKIKPDLFADCMYSIKLLKGTNKISMIYKIPCLKTGFLISLFGIFLIFFINKLKKNR